MDSLHAPPQLARPDLLGSSQPACGEARNILAALEGKGSRGAKSGVRHRRRGWKWLLGVGVLALAVLYGPDLFASLRLSASPNENQRAFPDAIAAQVTSGTQGGGPNNDVAVEDAAQIRDVAPAGTAASAPEPEAARGGQEQIAALKIDQDIPQGSLLELLESDAPKQKQASGSAAAQRPHSTTAKQSTSKSTSKNAHRSVRSGSDSDVALLTELVAAVNTTEAVQAQRDAPPKLGTGIQGNRDIVERTPSDSTAALLARCRRLGFLEGELCRWRICSGHHDDPACAPR